VFALWKHDCGDDMISRCLQRKLFLKGVARQQKDHHATLRLTCPGSRPRILLKTDSSIQYLYGGFNFELFSIRTSFLDQDIVGRHSPLEPAFQQFTPTRALAQFLYRQSRMDILAPNATDHNRR